MRTFEHRGGALHRFWHIEHNSRRLTVRFGKVGARGREPPHTDADENLYLYEGDME